MEHVHLIATLAIIAGSIVLYTLDRYPVEAVALTSLTLLLVLFGAFPYQPAEGEEVTVAALLAGFSSPALVTVLALLIVGKGLFATDALEGIINWIGRGSNPRRAITVILVVAGVTSAFLNNTPVVVIFIPVLIALAARFRLRAYRIFMPLSFVSILGGMTTLIGSSTNMIAAGVAAEQGIEVGFFDITGMGTILAVIGFLYVVLVLPRILSPKRSAGLENIARAGTQFLGEVVVLPTSRFAGDTARSGFFPNLAPLSLHAMIRNGAVTLPPYDDELTLAPGDRLQLTGTRKAFMDLIAAGEIDLAAPPDGSAPAGERKPGPHYHLAEAVIAPGSLFEGRTVRFSGIQHRFNVTIFGVRRKNRMARSPLAQLRLEAGDTLLVGGDEDDILSMRGNHDILLLEHSAESVPPRDKALIASVIFAGIVLFSASGLSPIAVNSVAGVVLMLLFGCLTMQQAARAFDRQIFLLVGASIAMSTALQATGGARLIAETIVGLGGGSSAPVIIALLFVSVALLTNVLSNNAAAALFVPIAIDMANQIDAPPAVFVAAVIYAANCSFATPIAYQTNLMVMGPGHYGFQDFMRAGIPLIILLTIAFAVLAPWYYGL
ncbi:potassium transporter TrkA [Martelella endophytica]|uniref:Potassium transporter TrkA n=1 Tax=Martelella endophytica TaxID=1486262 RepID=A0A0D5LUQ4_MAREN|nr:SLC13 family permease [Martelella endophytica]AJY47964.1 potassium transporter TrkA [Martelella endophytica]